MTILTPPRAAPEWLRELAAARARYEELFGWPVSVDVEPRRIVVPVGAVVDAVTMPSSLGEKVLAELDITMLAGPVTAGPGGAWWTFLSQPATAPRPEVPAELHAVKVRLTPRGAHAVLPTRDDNNGPWRWIARPQPHRALPPWSAVIAVTRRIVTGGALAAS
ncbi:hypothetical protein [Kutzneria sp. NPDC051319]|uniref:hypothetical protein n=1 Tax=Kutzneria sp. NPDC051319 TaxID=3155047 RepID=UPI00341AC906